MFHNQKCDDCRSRKSPGDLTFIKEKRISLCQSCLEKKDKKEPEIEVELENEYQEISTSK